MKFQAIRIFSLIGLLCYGSLATSLAQTKAGEDEYIIQQIFKLGKKRAYEAVFSSDNRFIVTLSGTHKLEVWNSRTGKLLKAFSTGKHQAISLIYHPRDALLITGGKDHTIRLWDVNRGTQTAVLRGHIGNVNALAFDAEGKTLISGSDDRAILVWDFDNLVLQSTIQKAHQGAIQSVALHPSRKIIASGGNDRSIRIWNLETGKMLVELKEHAGTVTAVIFHANGKFLATGSQDKTIKVWNWQERVAEYTLIGHENVVNSLRFHQNEIWLISGGADETIRLWDLRNGQEFSSLKSVAGAVIAVHFDNSSKRIVAALANGNAQSWELAPSSFLASLEGHERSITSLDFTKNGKYLLSAALDKTVKIWDIRNHKLIISYATGNHRIEELRVSQNSRSFATAGADSLVGIWETQSGERIGSLEKHRGKVNTIDYHPTDPVLLSGGSDRQWILWDLNEGRDLKVDGTHTDQVTVVRFSPQGNFFATGSADHLIQIWSYPEGQYLTTLAGHRNTVNALAFSPIAPILASASADNTIKLWELNDQGEWNLKYNLSGHQFIVSGIAFSKDGQVLISASRDKTVRLWDVEKGNLIRILNGERHPISAFALRPDKKLIALGTLGNEVVLLEYPFNTAEVRPMEHTSTINPKGEGNSSNLSQFPQRNALSEEKTDVRDASGLEETAEEIVSADIYKLAEEEDKTENREDWQQTLNALLRQDEVCKNSDELEATAFKVLQFTPSDLAAYHALLKTSLTTPDINMVFMLAKIGEWGDFMADRYNYAQATEVENNFNYWLTHVFDQSQVRQGDSLFLSISNCRGRLIQVEIGETLQYLDIPNEFLEKIVSIPYFIDFQDFQDLAVEEFKNRLLHQIQEKLGSTTPYPNHRRPLNRDFQAPVIPTGRLLVNLEQTQLWGNPKHLLFQLRESDNPWQSYFTAADRIKMLSLPLGQYYLKIGKTIRRAFVLKSNETVTLEGPDLQ